MSPLDEQTDPIRIELLDDRGALIRPLNRKEFAELPLADRIRVISNKQVRFYEGSKEITLKEALLDQ